MLRLKPKPVPEVDVTQMEALWSRYAKTQLRLAEEFEEQHPEIEPRTKIEEIHAWEDWALQNYVEDFAPLEA